MLGAKLLDYMLYLLYSPIKTADNVIFLNPVVLDFLRTICGFLYVKE